MELVSNIATLLSILGGGAFLFYRETKRGKIIENEAKQSEEWKKLYKESESKGDIKDEKIDRLYIELRNERNERYELRKELEAVKVENVSLKLLKCEVPACQTRKPKGEY